VQQVIAVIAVGLCFIFCTFILIKEIMLPNRKSFIVGNKNVAFYMPFLSYKITLQYSIYKNIRQWHLNSLKPAVIIIFPVLVLILMLHFLFMQEFERKWPNFSARWTLHWHAKASASVCKLWPIVTQFISVISHASEY